MSSFLRFAHPVSACLKRAGLFLVLASAVLLMATAAHAHAQFTVPSTGTQVLDAAALKPPTGARVAVVEFSDMECPACASYNPVIKAAVAKYKIPWMRHDFIIPSHSWSTAAAVYARWFDAKNKALGDEYRDQVFASQTFIYNPYMLRQFTVKFAQSHGIELPSEIDPQGKLSAEVQADSELGRRTGVRHTPTLFVVIANGKGAPYIEVELPFQQLDQIIGQALADRPPQRRR